MSTMSSPQATSPPTRSRTSVPRPVSSDGRQRQRLPRMSTMSRSGPPLGQHQRRPDALAGPVAGRRRSTAAAAGLRIDPDDLRASPSSDVGGAVRPAHEVLRVVGVSPPAIGVTTVGVEVAHQVELVEPGGSMRSRSGATSLAGDARVLGALEVRPRLAQQVEGTVGSSVTSCFVVDLVGRSSADARPPRRR